MVVVELEVMADGILQFASAAVDGAARLSFGQRREPTLKGNDNRSPTEKYPYSVAD